MENFTQFLIIMIVSGAMVFAATYTAMHRLLRNEKQRRNVELLQATKSVTLPLRLQAHERLMLLLERISLDALVLRVRTSDTTNAQLHRDLMAAVRAEFEHNLSQQMYVSADLWRTICTCKNAIMSAINSSAMEVEPKNNSLQLAQKLIDRSMHSDNPLAPAIQHLKQDVKLLF
ncbi:MAG: hypothetical protein ACRC9X_02650 [Bacteroidales bacterium]